MSGLFQNYKGLKYLLALEDQSIRVFYGSCDRRQLAIALATAPDEIQHKIMSNLSLRDANELDGLIQSLSSLAAPQVLNAQRNVVERAAAQVEEGKLQLKNEGRLIQGDEGEMDALFQRIPQLEDRGIPVLLREIEGEHLVLCLRKTSEEIRFKVLKNMTRMMAERVVDDLESSGPVRMTDIEDAQREVARTIKRLLIEGKIAFSAIIAH